MMVGDQEALKAFKSETSKRYYEAQKVYQAYLATPSQLKDELHQYSIPTPSGGRTGYIANTVMTRYVKPELQLLAGHLMRQLAAESGVPILELTETIPDELAAIFTAYQAAATTGWAADADSRAGTPDHDSVCPLLRQLGYIGRIFVNAPAPSRIRRVYQQQQGKCSNEETVGYRARRRNCDTRRSDDPQRQSTRQTEEGELRSINTLVMGGVLFGSPKYPSQG